MSVEKKFAEVISFLFHPLLMPSVGMLILFNSGSYLALLSPEVKRAVLLIILMSTLVFPLTLLPVLYYRNMISDLQLKKKEDRNLPLLLVLILYILTFVFMKRIPLHEQIHAYALALPVMVLVLFLTNIKYRLSAHMLGIGGITGLIIALIILFGIPLQALFVLAILASGFIGTARKILTDHSPVELYGGFFLGFITTGTIMIIY